MMRRHGIVVILAAVLMSACAAPTPPATPAAAESPFNIKSVPLPDYASDPNIAQESSREEYDAARTDAHFVLEQFNYHSDGLTVGAYLYRPKISPGRSPVIVFNRGSYVRQGFAGEILVMARRYAQAGFIVVAPHYRGSNDAPGRDEMGGADLDDLMSLAAVIPQIPNADPSHVYLAGESRGGMMVYQAIRDKFPARAAAVWGAFTDLEELIAPGGPQARYAPMIWPDIEKNHEAIVEHRSAIRWADRINTPVLIMHGEADREVPVAQSLRMGDALKQLRATYQIKTFPGAKHTIGDQAAERDTLTIAWFRRFGAR